MRRVDLNSSEHFKFRLEGSIIELVEFDGGCPMYGDDPGTMKVIASFVPGEEVEFVFGTIKAVVDKNLITDKIKCGDDLAYMLANPKTGHQ